MTCHSGKLASGTLQVILSWWTSLRIFCHLWLLVSRIKKESASTRPKGHYQSWLYLSCGICVASCVCVGGGGVFYRASSVKTVESCCFAVGECRVSAARPAVTDEVPPQRLRSSSFMHHLALSIFMLPRNILLIFFFSFHVLTYKET